MQPRTPLTAVARIAVTAVLMLTALVAMPDTATPLKPLHDRYAFENPHFLLQQRLFGLAHGVDLLATACADDLGQREAAMAAYKEWQERQAATIDSAARDLAGYYFGARAGEATRPDIVRALKLKDGLTLTAAELHEACATFPQALRNPRYDLAAHQALQAVAAQMEADVVSEAEAEACRALLPQRDAEALGAALTERRTLHAAENAQAEAALAAGWSVLQWEGSFNQFVTEARQRGKIAATPERCKAMAERLLTTTPEPDANSPARP